MTWPTTAEQAKWLLHRAAQHLQTANPVEALGPVLDESLAVPLGDPAARGRHLLEPSFNEQATESLALSMSTGGPWASPADRVETSTRAMRRLVRDNFGTEALHWFDGRAAPAVEDGRGAADLGALFASGFDRSGVMESAVTYEWGGRLMEALPRPLYQLARIAMDSLPGLRPAFSTIRCGRTSGSQQITFEVEYALPLGNLRPLMENLGLGHQHAGLMSACAFLLGARFTLPPNTATLTLRPTRAGVELRLDVNLDSLPDPPEQLISLLRLQMGERPRSVRALDRWMAALTPDGYSGPGSVSVLSVRVRADMPARVALYLDPAALSRPAPERYDGDGSTAAAPAWAAAAR